MIGLKDVLDLLDRWEEWRSLRATPARVASLEARIAALETLLAETRPPGYCAACGQRGLRLDWSRAAPAGRATLQEWLCQLCNKRERRVVTFSDPRD